MKDFIDEYRKKGTVCVGCDELTAGAKIEFNHQNEGDKITVYYRHLRSAITDYLLMKRKETNSGIIYNIVIHYKMDDKWYKFNE